MIEDIIVEKVKKITESAMNENSFPSHEYEHVLRVYNLCELIGKKEGANLFVLRIAALMHDLARLEELQNKEICHAEKSAEIVEKTLTQLKVDQNAVEQIKYAIRQQKDKTSQRFSLHLLSDT